MHTQPLFKTRTTETIRRGRRPGSGPTFFTVITAAIAMVLTVQPESLKAQEITVTSSAGSEIKLTAHMANVTFINSNADSAESALKNASLSAAEGKVLVAVGMKVLPIPVVGSLPLIIIEKFFRKHSSQTSKGFFVTFLPGLSAETSASPSTTFTITEQALQSVPGALPVLLRLSPSAKDAARMVRSTKASLKMSNSQTNPATAEIHETQQTLISCRLAPRGNGDINLTPLSNLVTGEYALVLTPAATTTPPEPMRVWDFRIGQ